ncbi:MAG: hypothetical protein QOK16_3318 [Solirubrobacteraceae bacterium]|jgi:DNA modification methylase|nr:hypothetical protein [Solirubrobacteraceae bacterium]
MRPIHPFPARMAPDLSRELLGALPPGSRVIDPMCGSGTVVRQAVEAGHSCVGRDVDPLAVLMTRAWTTPIPAYRLVHDAHEMVLRAQATNVAAVTLPWNDDDTDAFARYWFAADQIDSLARLCGALRACRYRTRDLLKICFSRLIITKDSGASLARDVSHSRPHRVAMDSEFDVYAGFLRAARLVGSRLNPHDIRGHATVGLGDARKLDSGTDGQFDAAMTSPPYLNAIDYLRGHRLTLIWFGHPVTELKQTRAASIGAERATPEAPFDIAPFITTQTEDRLGERYQGWIRRYATDMTATLAGLRLVVRPGGKIMLVVGNSLIRGAAVDNARIIRQAAAHAGLSFVDACDRDIPARRRYLPTPSDGSALSLRMRTESVLTFRVPEHAARGARHAPGDAREPAPR